MTKQQQSESLKTAALVKATAEHTAVALNIQYIQKDIVEIKQSLKEVGGFFVTKVDFEAHKKEDQDQEQRIRLLERNMWKGVGLASVLSPILLFILSQSAKLL